MMAKRTWMVDIVSPEQLKEGMTYTFLWKIAATGTRGTIKGKFDGIEVINKILYIIIQPFGKESTTIAWKHIAKIGEE